MPDSDNKQWFERESKPSNANRKKPVKKTGVNQKQHNSNNRVNASNNGAKKPGQVPMRHNPNVQKNDPNLRKMPTDKNARDIRKNPNVNRAKAAPEMPSENKVKPGVPENRKAVNAPSTKNVKNVKKKHSFIGNKANKKNKPQVNEDVKKPQTESVLPVEKKQGFDKNKANRERKQRGRKSVFGKALIATALCLAAAFILGAVIHHLFDYIAAKPTLTFISNGSVEHTIGARALIVRDEVLVPTDTTGDLVTQATEGSRVYKNQRIGMVVPENMQSVVASLRITQSQISDVQQELIMTGLAEGAENIYDDFNNGLNPIVDMIRLDAMDGKISGMSSYASSIAVLLNQRETTLAELDFDDERLRVLRSDEAAYENQLSRNATTIRASSPGVVSFRLDGLETELNFNVLLEADMSTIYSYVNDAVGVIPADLAVESGQNVARIASNEKQYIACFLDERTATLDAFAIGTRHTINIGSEGISIGKCVVERVEPTSHGLLVVFSTTRYVEDLLDLRSVDIEVVINETSGLRVPIASLVNPDFDRNIATIYVNNQGFCDEVSVIVQDYDREFAIIAPIGDGSVPNLHTVIITNPSSIRPGEKVDN